MATLSATGSLASLLDSVYPDKAVRDKARELTQAVAEAATALSLNQEVYRALAAIDMSLADPATTHYVSQTLLNYRLAGVDKDDATRAHLRELSDKATELSLTFAKHVQENVNRVEVRDAAELDGLPEDYIRNHPAGCKGRHHPDHRLPRHAAGDDLCHQRGFAPAHVPRLQHPRLSGQPATIARPACAAAADGLDPGLCFLGRSGHCQPDDGVSGQYEEVHRRTWSRLRVPAPSRNTRWCWPLPASSSRD